MIHSVEKKQCISRPLNMHKVGKRKIVFAFLRESSVIPERKQSVRSKVTMLAGGCGFHLLLRVVDPQQKDQLGQKHGRRRVGVDAPGVGLQAPQAGEHHDGEEEGQHGEAKCGVGDQGQRLQVALQLLLTERSRRTTMC